MGVSIWEGGNVDRLVEAIEDIAENSVIIDDTATTGDYNKTFSANKIIADLSAKYVKPQNGIPATDMASAVQTSLCKADTAYQKPVGGIPLTDIASNVETVTGSTPSIAGVSGMRYVCGECSTLSVTPPNSGIIDVIFESGTTPTVLTVPNTVIFPAWFDKTSLEASTTYEINILDGVWAVVALWQ